MIRYDLEGILCRFLNPVLEDDQLRKWMHCFDEMNAVIFMVSLSCYNEVSEEDETQNAMIKSLELFHEICNVHWFQRAKICLFLNKKDLLEEKLKRVPLNVCFPEYDGPNQIEPALNYIRERFVELTKTKDRAKISYSYFSEREFLGPYVLIINAVDERSVRKVMVDVHHILTTVPRVYSGLR